jgi:hypothetical protein
MNYEEYKAELLKFPQVVLDNPFSTALVQLTCGFLSETVELEDFANGTESEELELGDMIAYFTLIDVLCEQHNVSMPWAFGTKVPHSEFFQPLERVMRGDTRENWVDKLLTLINSMYSHYINIELSRRYACGVNPDLSDVYKKNIAKLQKRINKLGTFAKD